MTRFAMILTVLALCGTAASAQECDPFRATFEQALALRTNGHPDQARDLLQGVLKAHPDNLRAQYGLALALMDIGRARNGQAAKPEFRDGVQMLARVVDGVEKASSHATPAQLDCLKQQKLFSAANSLGAELFAAGELSTALVYLQKAREFDKHGLQNDDTRKKLYDNLGKVYFNLGDFKDARLYYTMARDAGAPNGAKGLAALDAIEANSKRVPLLAPINK
jgi:tetratricopeptide (TPR) repeat protein